MKIEEYCFESIVPINALAMLNRIRELLKENKTNSFLGDKVKEDWRIRILLITLTAQYFGTLLIDTVDEYGKAKDQRGNLK